MEVQVYSPFSTGKVMSFDDGTQELDMGDFSIVKTAQDDFYTPKTEERLDPIAFSFYNESVPDGDKYYWVIAIANDIEMPLDEDEFVGLELIIPNILDFKLRN